MKGVVFVERVYGLELTAQASTQRQLKSRWAGRPVSHGLVRSLPCKMPWSSQRTTPGPQTLRIGCCSGSKCPPFVKYIRIFLTKRFIEYWGWDVWQPKCFCHLHPNRVKVLELHSRFERRDPHKVLMQAKDLEDVHEDVVV